MTLDDTSKKLLKALFVFVALHTLTDMFLAKAQPASWYAYPSQVAVQYQAHVHRPITRLHYGEAGLIWFFALLWLLARAASTLKERPARIFSLPPLLLALFCAGGMALTSGGEMLVPGSGASFLVAALLNTGMGIVLYLTIWLSVILVILELFCLAIWTVMKRRARLAQ